MVPSSSHVQIKKSYVNDNDIRNQEILLTLDTISPTWARKLEESKLLPILSLERLRLSLELKRTSKCVVGEALVLLRHMYIIVKGVPRFLGNSCSTQNYKIQRMSL